MDAIILLVAVVIVAFMFGAIIGSFLNVVALRGLSGESIVLPPSKCPKCGNKLMPWHNIPILSYLFLRGKCAFCKEHISIQYPIVEFITGLFAVGVLFKYQFNLAGLFAFTILCILLVMSVTDIKEKVIITTHAWVLIAVGLVFHSVNTYFALDGVTTFNATTIFKLPIIQSFLGALAGIAIMELFAATGHLLKKGRAFGLGDTFIAAGLGAFFGVKGLVLSLILSIAIQVGFFLPKFFIKLAKQKDYQTLVALSLFIVASIGSAYALYNLYMPEFLQYIILIVLAGLGIWACVGVIRGLKQEGENVTVLPFGPAMAIAAVIVMFL